RRVDRGRHLPQVEALPRRAMIVDHICNAFTPDRKAVWGGALRRAGVPLKVQTDDEDSFAHPEDMVARMDELGIATLILPTAEVGHHGTIDPFDFEHVACRWDEAELLASR